MKTTELHTLESILTEGIRVNEQNNPIEISCIYIPKIQRAYAQGRNGELDVRNDFLDAIFDVLTSEEDVYIELSFLFGSQQMVAKRNGNGFELLDGQQRTTTLFLLYWYISMRENETVPEFLSKFTYETRDTSAQFIDNITSSSTSKNIHIKDAIPSNAIKNNKWFTDEFYCDPTVCAMLNMLDAINKKYNDRKCENIYERLNRLRFYVLMLEKFDMNDELYIKMNSRGLSLIPFENFKASLVKFMKSKARNGRYGTDAVENGQSPYWFDFITRMDAKWIDLFWEHDNLSSDEICNSIIEIDDRSIGVKYFNFINRFLFSKSCIYDSLQNSKLNSLSKFFYEDAESEKMHQRLFGWTKYEEMFSNKNEDYIRGLGKVLNTLQSSWRDIKAIIEENAFIKDFDICSDKITLPQRTVFAALIEFIGRIPEGTDFAAHSTIKDNFKRMLRVVANIIENTPIESPEAAARVIKAVTEITTDSKAVTDNFYRSLAQGNFNSQNRQLQEEIIKAKEMFSNEKNEFDENWENAFIDAERHSFFKGAILFFFTPNAGTHEDFRKRYAVIKDLFDENGIAEEYKKEHILIRAIISQINSWSKGLEGRYITEQAEKEKYLKILLTSYTEVRKMFCDYFDDNKESTTIYEYFEKIIAGAEPNENESQGFKLMYKRLVTDPTAPALFDWISRQEKSNKHFCLQYNRNSYLINIPGAWYDRMILDTERHLIIPDLIKRFNMKYENSDQEEEMNGSIKDTWGWQIKIYTEVSGKADKYKLLLNFNEWKVVDFLIYGKDLDQLAQVFNVPVENKQNEYIKVISLPYQLQSNIKEIEDEITKLESQLQAL